MLRWPLQFKLLLCVTLLLVIVGILAVSSLRGGYAYSELAKTISWRAAEFPLADDLSQNISKLRTTLHGVPVEGAGMLTPIESPVLKFTILQDFTADLSAVETSLEKYRRHLDHELPQFGQLGDRSRDRAALDRIAQTVQELQAERANSDWLFDQSHVNRLIGRVNEMNEEVATLRPELYQRMRNLSSEVRGQYRTWIGISWTTTVASLAGLLVLLRVFYSWVIAPLNVLIQGSRRIAKNDEFEHRIHLRTQDEMAELAENMNAMTARFLEIKTDQDEKIRQRTQEVVRSEQLASVGFLAAGVAHEINNPMAAIAMCAESLESRMADIPGLEQTSPTDTTGDAAIFKKYLRRIQDEAFRCKGITERLLDFSRLGDVKKQDTDLRELVQVVIDMVRHLGDYREKHIEFVCNQHVVAPVNAQEIKQVVLNLITNALDSLDAGGTVWVELKRTAGQAELLVRDNGCGMSPEVLRHLFEPFFTRRRDGKGTGLGLSITYRIIHEHGGLIEPTSAGAKKGSQMRVVLPLVPSEAKQHERQTQKRLAAA